MLIDKPYSNFPIIMLWGDRDGREFNRYGYCPVDDAEKLAQEFRARGMDVTFATVHGGHTILYEQPRLVVGELIKLLRQKLTPNANGSRVES